jgi:hypothetical protein
MDTVQQAAQVLAEHRSARMQIVGQPFRDCDCGAAFPDHSHAQHQAQALADAGLLADTRCRKCNGTGGTDLGGACCAVCDGAGHRRAER